MKILLTGHKGFIGRHLCKVLSADYHLYGFSNCEKLETWLASFTDFMRYQISDIDLILHFGAISDSRETGPKLWDLNYEATTYIAHYARSLNAKLIFASSCAAICPVIAYGWSKRTAENLLQHILPSEDLCILRFFNVWDFDESLKDNPSIVYKIITHQLPVVYKNCVQDFVHVSDVVKAITQLIDNWTPGIHQVGRSIPVNIETLVDDIAEHTDFLLKPRTEHNTTIAPRLVATSEQVLPKWQANYPLDPKELAEYIEKNPIIDEPSTDDHLI